jgi:hypothetical protein
MATRASAHYDEKTQAVVWTTPPEPTPAPPSAPPQPWQVERPRPELYMGVYL